MTGENVSCDIDERYVQVLSNQASRVIASLVVDVTDVEVFSNGSTTFRHAADTYERLALAEKRTTRILWERTRVDGRNGDELMQRLWEVREQLRHQDKPDRSQ